MTRTIVMLFVLALAAGRAAAANHPDVLALVITNNHSSETGRPELRYADDDGAKYYDLFRMLAPDPGAVELLTDFDRDSEKLFPEARAAAHSPTKAEVAAAVTRLAARAKASTAAGRATELYFVFAGHGDVDHGRGFLELRDGRLGSDELEQIVRAIPVAHVHVLLDSCNSFFVLNPRKPGGRQIGVTADAARSLGERLPNVGVFLSTSAEAEVFEWSELQSGIFSHAVQSGLAGGADANHDGFVSYDELRAFVEIATSHVKNPLYRPKVFSRAPDGRGDSPIIELAAAHAARVEVAAGPRRLTVRNPDELPWIDLDEEAGTTATLLVPERWAAGASLEERALDGTITRRTLAGDPIPAIAALTPRGADDMLAMLFDAPFGPRAFAAWRDEIRREPEPIYGISFEDAQRMEQILAQVAASERGSRRTGGVGLLGLGAVFLGANAAFATDDELRTTGYALGGGLALAGVLALATHTDGEKLYDSFVRDMADPATDKVRVVAETERRLDRLADSWRRTRHILLAGGLAVGVAGIAGLAINESTPRDAADRGFGRLAFGTMTALGAVLAVRSSFESPAEQMRDLWTHDPGISALPRFAISVAPAPNGGYLSLSGSF